MDDSYSSIEKSCTAQIKIEGSRFIADLFPAVSEEEAKEKLETVRKKYFDATHHCYAYVIGADRSIVRYSDDGEPSGTAGGKIHAALHAHHLSDILCVVTRYFGGTKLGVGGLGRAYFDSAVAGIAAADVIAKARMVLIRLSFPFEQTNAVMNLVNIRRLRIHSTEYTPEKTVLTLLVLPAQVDAIQTSFIDAARGKITCERKGDMVMVL